MRRYLVCGWRVGLVCPLADPAVGAASPYGANVRDDFTWCDLHVGHDGEWHYAHARLAGADDWWLRWRPGARELVILAGCTARDTENIPSDPEPCLLHADHVGRHTFEFDYRDCREGEGHRALTVGDLRKAIQHLDDDTAVRIGAVTANIFTPSDFEVLLQAAVEGTLPYTTASGAVDPALILLLGTPAPRRTDPPRTSGARARPGFRYGRCRHPRAQGPGTTAPAPRLRGPLPAIPRRSGSVRSTSSAFSRPAAARKTRMSSGRWATPMATPS